MNHLLFLITFIRAKFTFFFQRSIAILLIYHILFGSESILLKVCFTIWRMIFRFSVKISHPAKRREKFQSRTENMFTIYSIPLRFVTFIMLFRFSPPEFNAICYNDLRKICCPFNTFLAVFGKSNMQSTTSIRTKSFRVVKKL